MKLFDPQNNEGTKEYGGLVKFILTKEICPDLSAGLTILEPRESLKEEEIHNDLDEVFYILDGTLTIYSSGKKFLTAKQGQFVLIPKKFPHHSKNMSNKQLTFLWFAANK